ncbi:MAG: hypothetical protein IPI46_10335 [Bacteroidetes bacterium]|nr:hypothetical protein [Bacteroidota bacterium]
MKKIIFILLSLFTSGLLFAQDNLQIEVNKIMSEGRTLYKSIKTDQVCTQIFKEKYKGKEKATGSIIYAESEMLKCVYYVDGSKPKAIAIFTCDSSFDKSKIVSDFTVRELNSQEKTLASIKQAAMELASKDASFTKPENSSFSFIPMLENGIKKVIILCLSNKPGIVIFGNDYEIRFNNDNEVTDKKQIHPNQLIAKYGEEAEAGSNPDGTSHIHFPQTGELMTSTDVCLLMLYEKEAHWKQHTVISENFISFYNCQADVLLPIPKNGDGKNMKK